MAKRHSVLLKEEECEGCTNCVKNCPTKAIRVHQGKATIKENLCIDCAECIRTCEYHAKYTETDKIKNLDNYEYPIALIPPSFYGQFKTGIKPLQVVKVLKKLGFKEVRNVALAAEAISKKTVEILNKKSGPYISSSCPVVVRLIKTMYPELVDYLIPIKSPVELMAQKVKKELINIKNIKSEKIGIFFITPCPAKLTTVNNPLAMEKSYLDGAIAVDKIYEKVIKYMDKIKKNKDLKTENNDSPFLGISWGQSGGEVDILNKYAQIDTLAVDSIPEVKGVLDEISRDNIQGIKYFELVACPEGCVGGVLNVKNPYQAKHNVRSLIREQNTSMKKQDFSRYDFELTHKFEAEATGKLDDDIIKAMEKLEQLEKEKEILPGLDCASCGAPDCETLAEDIVNGKAKRTDCIFMLRKEMEDLAERISSLTHELPPVMAEKNKNREKEEGDAD